MPVLFIDRLEDPRLQPYRQLKTAQTLRGGELFVAEGSKVVARLLDSSYRVDSILLSEKRWPAWQQRIPSDIPVYVVPQDLGAMLVGFNFHVGVMACGRRQPSPRWESLPVLQRPTWLIVACERCEDPENLGAILRLCGGFGVSAVVLGPGSCDPFSRRVLRVSMGASLFLPIIETHDLNQTLQHVRQKYGARLAATVLDQQAEPLSGSRRSARWVLVLGNEHAGLSPSLIAQCDCRVTIPMSAAVDSLNVAVAAGIFLYHYTQGSGMLEPETICQTSPVAPEPSR
ncbi:MAG: rRNA methyltransferase [Planctomycetaceae bacterium]|nr:MAG: rRNA methyltransferase [Planctomycetaceae bacterium]